MEKFRKSLFFYTIHAFVVMCFFYICSVPESYQGRTCSVLSWVKGTSTRIKYGAGTEKVRL